MPVCPITVFSQWVTIVLKSSASLDIWHPSGVVFKHFCCSNSNISINITNFKKRMTTLCSINAHVYKKSIYIKDLKKYETWYLFVKKSDRSFTVRY